MMLQIIRLLSIIPNQRQFQMATSAHMYIRFARRKVTQIKSICSV